jgi:hypothetical protein
VATISSALLPGGAARLGGASLASLVASGRRIGGGMRRWRAFLPAARRLGPDLGLLRACRPGAGLAGPSLGSGGGVVSCIGGRAPPSKASTFGGSMAVGVSRFFSLAGVALGGRVPACGVPACGGQCVWLRESSPLNSVISLQGLPLGLASSMVSQWRPWRRRASHQGTVVAGC